MNNDGSNSSSYVSTAQHINIASRRLSLADKVLETNLQLGLAALKVIEKTNCKDCKAELMRLMEKDGSCNQPNQWNI